MSINNEQELQKTIDIAKEFVRRAEKVANNHFNEGVDNSAMKRQSMELTRQLAILRRA